MTNEKKVMMNFEHAFEFLMEALEEYHHAPAWMYNWLDAFYVRLWEDAKGITLDEIFTLSSLRMDDGNWMPEQLACNTIYKLLDRLNASKPAKYDLTGIIGY